MKDAPQGVEESVDRLGDSRQPVGRQQAFHQAAMFLIQGVELRKIDFVARRGQPAEPDQGIGAAADGGADEQGPVALE